MKLRDLAIRIGRFASERSGADVRVRTLRQFTVGFSWLTYWVEFEAPCAALPASAMILRLGPGNGLYAPYSARRQFQLLSALAVTRVPTPKVYWMSDDPSLLGAPFFFCECAPGRAPLPTPGESGDPVLAHLDQLGEQFVAALAELHRFEWWNAPELVDWEAGISGDDAALRQIEVCADEYARWAVRPEPTVLWALAWLRRHAPRASRISVVHADYRIGNFLVHDGRISAVLDWESSHLGDPHEDLAYAILPHFRGRSGLVCRLMTEEAFLRRYEELAGVAVDVVCVRYYSILSALRMALVNLAATHCFECTDTADARMAALGTQSTAALRQVRRMIESYPG